MSRSSLSTKCHDSHALPSLPILDISRRHMTPMNNSAVTCNDFMSFEIWSNMASESIITDSEGSAFQVLEGVVYYVDQRTSSNAMNAFVGSKERVRIPLSG